jgi:uncharacterized damage-inducible protein DinB
MQTAPDPTTLPPFYSGYVSLVQDMNMMKALSTSGEACAALLKSLPDEMGHYRYAPEKWSINELVCHMMDAERIFAYRALRFSRKDDTPLAGFEEKTYAPQANAHSRTLQQLAAEMQRLRATTIDLFDSFTPDMLQLKGNANNSIISVVNIGYVIAGHEMHHCAVIQERYLKAL